MSSIGRLAAPQPPASRARRLHLKCSAAGGSASPSVKEPVKVLLKIPYRVNFGQTVAVLGTGDLLGDWEPTKAVRMSWTSGDFWEAEISVEPGSATQLEYKYVVLNSNSTVSHWKPGQNYKLDVLAARGTRVLVTETWDDGPRHVEVDMEDSSDPVPTSTASTSAPAAAAAAPAKQQPQHSNGSSNGARSNGAGSSNGAAAAAAQSNGSSSSSNGAAKAAAESPSAKKTGKEPQKGTAAAAAAAASVPQVAPEPASSAVAAVVGGPMSGAAIIQQEAQAAMSELKDALDRQVNTLQRVTDPAAIEVLMGDRLLAAANSKAVALNRAVRAAEALPMLPPSTDVTARSASPAPPSKAKEPAGKNGSKRA